jgi:hypothetical protein
VKENKAVVCHEGRQRIWQWGLALARSVVRERIRTLLVVHRSRQLSGIIIGEGIAAPTGTEGLPFCAHNASAPRFAVPAWAIVRFSDPGKSQISPCFRRWYRNNRCRLRVLNINLDVKRSFAAVTRFRDYNSLDDDDTHLVPPSASTSSSLLRQSSY